MDGSITYITFMDCSCAVCVFYVHHYMIFIVFFTSRHVGSTVFNLMGVPFPLGSDQFPYYYVTYQMLICRKCFFCVPGMCIFLSFELIYSCILIHLIKLLWTFLLFFGSTKLQQFNSIICDAMLLLQGWMGDPQVHMHMNPHLLVKDSNLEKHLI